ncbi:MAG: hypothetical protein HY360_25135, partial [Verrucomicrobia bacterium]|nr:hypothetical protein [Verrucomicrobiota bacterium]
FTHCLLQFETGAIGSIVVSANHRTLRQGLLRGRLLGARGRIDFTIYPYRRSLNEAVMILDGGKSVFVPDVVVRKLNPRFPPSLFRTYPGFFDVYQREVHAFLEAIRHHRAPPITAADGRAAVEVVLAAYSSQGAATDKPNFKPGNRPYRVDAACHPLLRGRH